MSSQIRRGEEAGTRTSGPGASGRVRVGFLSVCLVPHCSAEIGSTGSNTRGGRRVVAGERIVGAWFHRCDMCSGRALRRSSHRLTRYASARTPESRRESRAAGVPGSNVTRWCKGGTRPGPCAHSRHPPPTFLSFRLALGITVILHSLPHCQ